ncbi:type IX secretion system plug protein [Seonamhaeicola marinus]|uniref:DUF5103 domain-containing protein n=1 Tax=Seonamhaeicola marinus TaxID=1912246 RepID=A0A5D0IKP1_9FLAO|nr:DUF5103 domain-containing protein [Seonamhaeicola marinus]TYA84134.1 DUF5103 domain-containing protein [Seonamhaeicola marinus]
MLHKTIYFLGIFLITQLANCQLKEVNPPEYIKTINFKGNTAVTQLPVIRLGEPVVLEFDALNGDEEDYYYKIQHCNFDWTPSILAKSEYLDGFDNQRIRDYENSYNTLQIYSHYKLSIPNQFTRRLKKSGNYLVSIYNSYDELVFSRKFMIYEDKANVGIGMKRSRDIDFINEKQRVEIIIDPKSIQLNNPMQTVNTLVVQNNNLNTAISNLKPQYTVGNQLIYRYDKEASFWGGNEYLYFENKDVRAAATGVYRIDLQDLYHNYLYTNLQRSNLPYTYNPDINGNYLITNVNNADVSIESDYVWIHFSLRPNSDFDTNSTLFVYGNFNNYAVNETNKMTYDASKGIYMASILLKQGFYNYKYVTLSDGTLNEGAISGNFYQTENNYKVLVYYRDLGGRYDKIIGLGETTSINISN